MFKFITQKPLWINLIAALALVLILLVLFFGSLGWITGHGDIKKIPSVVGKNIDEAKKILEAQGFDVQVQDSVYIDTTARAAVIKQTPEADEEVKVSRTVYLTINRTIAPLVEMPDLRGFSFLSAKLYLQSLSLKLGDTSYRPDIARNSVLDQLLNNINIKPGTKINMGSVISLVLGDGVGSEDMDVPDLSGMAYTQAKQYVESMNLSIGAVIPNADVKDTASAFVYKQSPEHFTITGTSTTTINRIRPGQLIDIYLSLQPPVIDSSAVASPNINSPK